MRDFPKFSLLYGNFYDMIKATEENVAERVGYPTLSCFFMTVYNEQCNRYRENVQRFMNCEVT